MKYMQVRETLINLGDPVKIGLFLQLLKVDLDDFANPKREKQIQELCKFLSEHPDPEFFVRRAIGSKNVDRIEFMHEYMTLHQDMVAHNNALEEVKEKINAYGPSDEAIETREQYFLLDSEKSALENKLKYLQEEIRIYEK